MNEFKQKFYDSIKLTEDQTRQLLQLRVNYGLRSTEDLEGFVKELMVEHRMSPRWNNPELNDMIKLFQLWCEIDTIPVRIEARAQPIELESKQWKSRVKEIISKGIEEELRKIKNLSLIMDKFQNLLPVERFGDEQVKHKPGPQTQHLRNVKRFIRKIYPYFEDQISTKAKRYRCIEELCDIAGIKELVSKYGDGRSIRTVITGK